MAQESEMEETVLESKQTQDILSLEDIPTQFVVGKIIKISETQTDNKVIKECEIEL